MNPAVRRLAARVAHRVGRLAGRSRSYRRAHARALRRAGAITTLILLALLARPAAAQVPWKLHRSINPLDDTQTTIASGVDTKNRVGVVVRCKGGELDVLVVWHRHLGSDPVITHRFPPVASQQVRWDLSTDSKITFSRDPEAMALALAYSSRFVASVHGPGLTPVVAEIDLAGSRSKIAEAAGACGLRIE